MFKLHRLEISGFKSFPDPVNLDFGGGLTAVVGPNGCGKSNVADAVLWVLGERSAKILRSAKMEDVIFNGAAGRKPLGSAEVNIELRTDPTFSLADDGILKIGRRVFRSGESEYRLNGKRVRLKEIRDLLMDTGLGIRAYSVIEQGRIGMILSSKPQERRRLLEEAAGITRYKERKRLTEMKLEEARANLARLDDIIDEVKRQLRSLKRQANAARRYRDRESNYKDLLRSTLEGRWSRLYGELSGLRSQCGGNETREAELAARVHTAEAAVAGDREQTEAQARELAAHHRRQAELAARIEGKQEFLKGSRERLEEIAERLTAGRAAAGERRQRIAAQRTTLSDLENRHTELEGQRGQADDEVSREDERIAAVEQAYAEMESRIEALRAALMASIGDVGSLRNRLHREQVETEKGRFRQAQLGEELTARRKSHAEAEANRQHGAERLAELEAGCRTAQSELEAAEEALAEIVTRRAETDERQRRQRDELSELVNRRRVLTQLGEAQAERRRALEERLQRAGLERLELLTEGLQVPEGWERSLDLYLGELADAVLVGDDADALDLADILATEGGATRLIQVDATVPLPAPPSDPAIEGSLAGALGLPDALAAALPPAYLATSREDAARLARSHPGTAFLSRDRSWAQAGILHVQGAKAEPGALARRREMDRLVRDIPAAEGRLETTIEELETLAGRRAAAETAVRENRGIVAELRQQTAVAQARCDDLTAAVRRLRLESETLATELSEIGRELGRVVADSESLAGQMTSSEARHAELETEFDTAQKELNAARDRREIARTSGVSRRGHLQLLESRLEAHGDEMARVRSHIEEDDRQIAAWQSEAERLECRRRDIGAAMEAAEVDLQEALETRAEADERMRDRQTDLDARQAALHTREREIHAWRRELDDERSRLSDLRVREAALAQDAEHLAESFRESFDEPLPESPGEVPADLEKLEHELARSKEILEGTGPVNLLAAQEYDEQQERFTFLSEQHADVTNSVESLKNTIREINETSSERFLKTFLEVNETFEKTFKDLFRGGDATMRLLDEEDVLDSGIEIVARPPGKRLQNIMLLSGGEKALTAIALLFALFRTKPSPFCILDEVDAPLDDVNTLRFVDLLKQMDGETQFVVMTHNKLTMEASSRLYGVTMQERGVSSIVAVELDDIHPVEAPATAESISA